MGVFGGGCVLACVNGTSVKVVLVSPGVASQSGTIKPTDTCALLRWLAYGTPLPCLWTNEKSPPTWALRTERNPAFWTDGFLLL